MQINVHPPAPVGMMEAMMFAKPTNEIAQFVQMRNEELNYRVQNFYGAEGKAFIENSNNFYQNYSISSGIQAAEAIALATNNALANHSGALVALETFEELQEAKGRYQQYLMANPLITKLYYENRIDGYGETFVDTQPGKIGIERDAYRSVINGMSRSSWDETFESEGEEWIHLSNSDCDSGNSLTFQEKVNVLKAYSLQAMAVSKGIDPTSIDGFNVRPKS